MSMEFCRGCGQQVHADAATCPHCGFPLKAAAGSRASSNKSQTSAFLFAWLLGGFGAHRFYLGSIGLGILYLFTGGLFGIGVLVDMFKLAFMKPDVFAERFNGGNITSPIGSWAKVVVLFFPCIAFIGILAAIALPAYQDYTARARTAAALTFGESAKITAQESYSKNGYCMAGNTVAADEKGFYLSNNGSCEITITFKQKPQKLAGKSVLLSASLASDDSLEWSCHSENIPSNLLPANCREPFDAYSAKPVISYEQASLMAQRQKAEESRVEQDRIAKERAQQIAKQAAEAKAKSDVEEEQHEPPEPQDDQEMESNPSTDAKPAAPTVPATAPDPNAALLKKFVVAAQVCLQKSQLDCAISKAEAALEVDPKNTEAKRIKAAAEKKQKDAFSGDWNVQ